MPSAGATIDDTDAQLSALAAGSLHPFSAWDRSEVAEAPGVYAVWRGAELIYVGMAGRAAGQKSGLRGRLVSHTNGRRSGDQFCVYICDRLVVPHLTKEQLAQVADGSLSLDKLT